MASPRKAVVVGISGASSSGKTTISRLIRDIFPNTFVLHEDDFYLPEEQLPKKHDLLDWDCAESLSIQDIEYALKYIREEGKFPVSESFLSLSHRSRHGVAQPILTKSLTTSQPSLNSYQDQNSVGPIPITDATVEDLKSRVKSWTQPGNPGHGLLESSDSAMKVYIFDGFLLYSKEMAPIQPYVDIKIFLKVSYAKAKARREARSGYVTLEGFWEDPPGYVDKIVWPNYVEAHRWMFEDEDVEGNLKKDVVEELHIRSPGGGTDVDLATTLEWTVDLLMQELPALLQSDSS
ncbi:P-loop containing nucleoside triphosphate hydrolase protein [Xylogone sp. PMI_703]|nr:P-loop containing nucleoside triphosphate hydrolase protein [Xylogone sp. PMI_703]